MSNGKDKEHQYPRQDRPGASDNTSGPNPLSHLAQLGLQMGGHSWSPSPGSAEAQQYSSTPALAASGYVIQQPRPAPYHQGQLATAQYSGNVTGGPQPLSGGYSASAHQQTTEDHKRARESSSSSGDQQLEHDRSHRKHGGSARKHKKPDYGSHHEPRRQPETQGANLTPAVPQYQPGPWQNTNWPTNAPVTAGHGGGGGRGYGDDMPERQSDRPAGLSPPASRGVLPPMRLEPPWPATMPPLPRQQQRRDLLPPMLTGPPQLAPFGTQPQSGRLPSLQMEQQQRGSVQPPVPAVMGTGPAASDSDNSPDPFNVDWRGDTFAICQQSAKGLTPLQFREARVLVASFATWDEVSELGQELPGGRTARTIAEWVKRDDGGSYSGLQQWHEWTRAEDLILWAHRAPPPTQNIVDVAARLQSYYFRDHMLSKCWNSTKRNHT